MTARSIAKAGLRRLGLDVRHATDGPGKRITGGKGKAGQGKAGRGKAGKGKAGVRDPFQLSTYRAIYDEATLARRPFYNVGAGGFWHPHWTNIDFVTDWYAGVQRDVVHYDLTSTEPLPIADGSAEVIYTSHTVEHVTEAAVERLFRESYRALRPGGVLRVTTGPDAETDYRALLAGDARWFYWDKRYVAPGSYEHIYRAPATSVPLEERWLHHVASQLAPNDLSPSEVKLTALEVRAIIEERGFEGSLDYLTGLCSFNPERPGNHISWWSHGKLLRFLNNAGFESAYRSGHGQSVLPILRNTALFDSTHPQMSAYVEAVR